MKQADVLASKGIDAVVGGRVRHRRRELGLSAEDLANAVGVTHTQITHYETGLRRMASARLFAISQALDAPIAYFFADLENQHSIEESDDAGNTVEHTVFSRDLILELTFRLAKMANRSEDVEVRKALRNLLKIIPDVSSQSVVTVPARKKRLPKA